MTLEELNQLNDLRREIKTDQQRLEELRARAYGSTSNLSGAPSGGNNESRISRYYALIENLEKIIEEKIEESLREEARLLRYISTIPDILIRQIFTLRFADGLGWQDVAQRIGGGNSWKSISNMCYRYLDKTNSVKVEDKCGT